MLAAVLAIVSSATLASPEFPKAGPKPSGQCAAKIDYCRHTSVVLALAVRAVKTDCRKDDNFWRLSADEMKEAGIKERWTKADCIAPSYLAVAYISEN
jgi:hypothetical protein